MFLAKEFGVDIEVYLEKYGKAIFTIKNGWLNQPIKVSYLDLQMLNLCHLDHYNPIRSSPEIPSMFGTEIQTRNQGFD